MFTKKPEGWIKHADFIFIDLGVMVFSLLIGFILRFGFNGLFDESVLDISLTLIIIDAVALIVSETYKNVLKRGYWKELKKRVLHSGLVFGCITMVMFIQKTGHVYSRLFVIISLVIYTFLSYIACLLRKKQVYKKIALEEGKSMLILTSMEFAETVIAEMRENGLENYTILGLVVESQNMVGKTLLGEKIIASYDTVLEYIRTNWVDEILVYTERETIYPTKLIERIEEMGTTVHLVIGKRNSSNVFFSKIGPYECATRAMNSISFNQAIAKRTLDIIGGLFGCFLTAIIYLIIAPKIKKESPGPVLYTSTRIGLNGKPFKMYKFRSMHLDADLHKEELQKENIVKDGYMFKMEWDPRIIGNYIDENGVKHTGIGEKIRRSSIDEFPQFYNVLKGEMSLVGTRPPTPDEILKYENYHKSRLSIKPGITGLWQVSGRSDITDFEEVVALDREYINNYSFGMDLRILLQTVIAVVGKKGAK